MVLGLDSSSSKWILIYFPVSWITQFGHGLVTTVVGPTQPYLARNTGVNIDTINLVWTFGFFGYMVGSLGTSFIFKRYLRKPAAKLCFLWLTIFLTGVRSLELHSQGKCSLVKDLAKDRLRQHLNNLTRKMEL